MYEQYWNLTLNPFVNDRDPNFFFRSETHQAALLKLRYLIENRKGAGLLVGGTGSGKTYLAALLAHELEPTYGPFIHIVFPQLSAAELLADIAVRLGANESSIRSQAHGMDHTIRQIERQIKEYTGQGRHPVIIIDETHTIEDPNVLRALQLLLNFQNHATTNFTLIFLGERLLLSRLRRITQLDERLAVKSLLQPLSRDATARYVAFRLEAAGSTKTVFDQPAIDELFELSGGVPRRINRICDLALLVGYADGMTSLSAPQIEAVAVELDAVQPA